MEKINCNVIQDILPLYIDDVIIRVEVEPAAFIAPHGAVHDQGGHRHQVAQFQDVRRDAVPPVEVLHLPVKHPEARGRAVQPFVGPHDGDIIPHQAADFIPIVIDDGKFVRQGGIPVVPRGDVVRSGGILSQRLEGEHGVQRALGDHHAFQQGVGGQAVGVVENKTSNLYSIVQQDFAYSLRTTTFAMKKQSVTLKE